MDIFIIVVLLLLSAVFSASETAFSAAKDTRLRAIAQDGGKRAKLAAVGVTDVQMRRLLKL